VADASGGLFETLLVRDRRIQALHPHLDRLAASVVEVYACALPDRLAATVADRAAGLSGPHRLRIDAIPEGGGLRIELETSPLDPARPRHHALRAVTIPGGHGPHKWRDRRALDGGPGVPLIVDADGSVLEAAWANVWLLDGRRLITPPADGRLLPGVTRARLLKLAPSLGLEAGERRVPLAELRAARTVLLTSSLALAVTAAVDREPPGDSEIVEAIRAALERDGWQD
jgi:para-aminobenzoate synthetase/4-amino-4-deoxychorismate lyase